MGSCSPPYLGFADINRFYSCLLKYILDSYTARLFEIACRLFIADIDIKCNDLKDIGAEGDLYGKSL